MKKRINKDLIDTSEKISGRELVKVTTNYTLKVDDKDPSNSYTFNDNEKLFISNWIEYKNVNIVSQIMNIDNDTILNYLNNYYINNEIKKLEEDITKKRLSQKILTLDELQSYLSSLIVDYNVPQNEKLSTKDKISAIKMLTEIKELKAQTINGNNIINAIPETDRLNELSVDTIKSLLNMNNLNKTDEEKKKIINELLSISNLSSTEIIELQNKPLDELKDLLSKWKN